MREVGDTGGPIPIRYIGDVETLRVLADPLRIAILRTLMDGSESVMVVMSAKELAATLGEPQTKLYRHLKQLEEAGLIQVAETRLVSGITEQRYRAGQIGIGMSRELVTGPASRLALVDSVAAGLDDFRSELVAHWGSGRAGLEAVPGEERLAMIVQSGMSGRMDQARAIDFRERLSALVNEFLEQPEDPDGVPVRMMVGWYALKDPPTPAG